MQSSEILITKKDIEEFAQVPAHKIAIYLIRDAQTFSNNRFKNDEKSLKWFEFNENRLVSLFYYIVFFVHIIVLPIIETNNAYERYTYYLLILEAFFVVCHILRVVISQQIQPKEHFYVNRRHLIISVICLINAFDIILFAILKLCGIQSLHRYTRCLRCLYFIYSGREGKELRRALRSIKVTMNEMKYVLTLYALSVLIFTFLGWRLFAKMKLKYPNGAPYFQTYDDSLWDMYVLITTSNFPDIMMPAYSVHGGYALYFISFLIFNLTILLNIVLAVIFSNYKKHLKEEVDALIEQKANKLDDAFNKLAVDINIEDETNETIKGIIEKDFYCFLKVFNKSLSSNQIGAYFKVLDEGNKKFLTKGNFRKIADLLNVYVTTEAERQLFLQSKFPNFWDSKFNKYILDFFTGMYFNAFCDFINIANLLLTLYFENIGINRDIYLILEWIILIIFALQIIGRVYSLGIREVYIQGVRRYWNLFDTFVIIVGILMFGLDTIFKKYSYFEGNFLFISFDLFIIMRLSRVIILISHVQGFRSILSTIGAITPSLATYGSLVLSVFYLFTMIGLELFKGLMNDDNSGKNFTLINCGNEKLNNTEFVQLNYCKNNFNDFLRGMVVMFELMIVSQWQTITHAFVSVTNNKNTRLFFFAFHFSGVLVTVNIFTAFVLEVFLHIYEDPEKTHIEIELKKRIQNIPYDVFDGYETHVTAKRGRKLLNYKNINSEKEFFKNEKLNKLINSIIFKIGDLWISIKYWIKAAYEMNRVKPDTDEAIVFHFIPKRAQPLTLILYRLLSDEDETFEIEPKHTISSYSKKSFKFKKPSLVVLTKR